MILCLRQLCWAMLLVSSADPSHAAQREAIENVDFATFRIDLLPSNYTIPRYELTQRACDLGASATTNDSTISVIEARIENPDGETWAHVYQMLPPEEGGSVTCASTALEIPEYCGSSLRPTAAACTALWLSGSSAKAYRAKRHRSSAAVNLYTTLDGTLVAFAFASEPDWDEIEQALEAMETMTRSTPRDLLEGRSGGSMLSKLWRLLPTGMRPDLAPGAKDIDRIPFTKLLPTPLPSGFDRIQGYAYWNKYGLEFQASESQEHSQLRMEFSERARMPRLKTCWAGSACDLVATTRKGREIYSPRAKPLGGRPGANTREYYVDIEGTLVVLSWPHWTQSEGKLVYRSHEFAPGELETLIDSLEVATSRELARFPHMSIMSSYAGAAAGTFGRHRIIETRPSNAVKILPYPKDCGCLQRDDRGVRVIGRGSDPRLMRICSADLPDCDF